MSLHWNNSFAGPSGMCGGGSKEQSCLVVGQSPPLVVCLPKHVSATVPSLQPTGCTEDRSPGSRTLRNEHFVAVWFQRYQPWNNPTAFHTPAALHAVCTACAQRVTSAVNEVGTQRPITPWTTPGACTRQLLLTSRCRYNNFSNATVTMANAPTLASRDGRLRAAVGWRESQECDRSQ